MSLLEDIRDVLYVILEYFGVPPDMLVPVWDSQLCGSYRSLVRMIGTSLPLAPLPRVHFQIPMLSNKPHGYIEFTTETAAIPSLADVLWVYEDEGESFAKTRNYLPPSKQGTVNPNARSHNPALRPTKKLGAHTKQAADPSALEKISALESELLRLQAQIAMIVTAAPGAGLVESQNAPGTPGLVPPPPGLTSTPRAAAAAPPLPPPPPPPPLPPPVCSNSSAEKGSVLELIRRRKKDEKDSSLKREEFKGIPSMLDVLKDLNQVKLRTVERSPGGTPVRRRRSKGVAASLSDPAALIAEALKRKFIHHRLNNSSDKENSLELSPFGSPETPKVPHPTRRSQGHLFL
ncbi:mitochondrial fission regulator 2 [Takifugu flavidus]|uniref:Mitochondrial fission regulator n=1 Tax=Takifugu flavidus TaxID=433684 RepID=A0A5C6NPV7_9TELE|nr:mitochondrial fission regulator 2 [Takifugu flavidus]TWW68955.1 Mitochondrial fission regulator 2 [Takifugu flavidus]